MSLGVPQIIQRDGAVHAPQAVQQRAVQPPEFRMGGRIAGEMAEQGGAASHDVEDRTHAAHPGAVKASTYTRSAAIH